MFGLGLGSPGDGNPGARVGLGKGIKLRMGLHEWKGPGGTKGMADLGQGPILDLRSPSCRWSGKAMAPHSSTLAWKIPWTEEPGRLQSMESLRVGHD